MAEAQAAADAPKPDAKPDGEPSPGDKDPATGKTYTQAELDRITAKVRKNAQRDAELRFRREQQAQQQQPPAKADAAPPKEEAEPKREDFETYEDHQRALTQYEARKTTREENAKVKKEEQERAQREQQEKAAQTWKTKIDKAMAKHADFEDVLEDNSDTMDLVYRSPMRAAITESEIGPEIVRHLCLNKEEAKRIAALPAYKQAAAIDKIETELLAAAKPAKDKGDEDEPDAGAETPEEKQAREDRERDAKGRFQKEPKDPPAPIEPGTGRSATNSSLPSDKDDPETWRRKELARMRKLQGK